MTGRTGGEVAVEALRALGVEQVFGVASVHNLPILDAIHRRADIGYASVRHEQAAVHAADGYARATGRLGVALTSTGPGAANAMGGLFEAGFASSPVLMVTGQVESRFYGRGRGYLHEAERQLDMLASVTRQALTVRRLEDLGETVVAAGRAAVAGRPQPTAVEIPVDLQYARTDQPMPSVAPIAATKPPADRLREAAELLRSAARPIVWAGGGVVGGDASDELRGFVDDFGIPVVTSTQGRGALPEDHPLCLGALAADPPLCDLIAGADVMLAVGTRFQMYPTGLWSMRPPPSLIHVDVDPSVPGRSYDPTVTVVGEARLALRELRTLLEGHRADDDWVRKAVDAGTVARESALGRIGPDHRAVMESIRRLLPAGGAIVRDSTIPAYAWGDRLLPVLAPRTSMSPASAAIGPGLPLAIGATLGRGERSVVIHGDGGIMLTIGELATLAQLDLPLTVCVFNDGGYGILRQIQSATFDGARHDVDLGTPDFVRLAESMGVPAELVRDPDGFVAAFERSVEREGPYLVEVDLSGFVPVDAMGGPQELLG